MSRRLTSFWDPTPDPVTTMQYDAPTLYAPPPSEEAVTTMAYEAPERYEPPSEEAVTTMSAPMETTRAPSHEAASAMAYQAPTRYEPPKQESVTAVARRAPAKYEAPPKQKPVKTMSYQAPTKYKAPSQKPVTTMAAPMKSKLSTSGFGQNDAGPPAPREMNWGVLLGWGAIVATAVGLFYAVTRDVPTPVRPNRRRTSRRRRTRRRSRRPRRNTGRSLKWATFTKTPTGNWRRKSRHRTMKLAEKRAEKLADTGRYSKVAVELATWNPPPTRRRSSRRRRRVRRNLKSYKALSAAARKRMPQSSFALPGKRFPIKGPPGSSRERDKWQAMQAIRYLHMGRIGSRQDYLKVRNAVIRRYGMSFWRKYDGPSWNKVQQAKRKRQRSRRKSRRMAANRRTSRRR